MKNISRRINFKTQKLVYSTQYLKDKKIIYFSQEKYYLTRRIQTLAKMSKNFNMMVATCVFGADAVRTASPSLRPMTFGSLKVPTFLQLARLILKK